MAGFSDKRVFCAQASSSPCSPAEWREYMREIYFKIDVDVGGASMLTGNLAKRSFAQAEISFLHAKDAQRFIRSRELVKEDIIERFCLVFPTSGVWEHRQRVNCGKATDGGVYIVNANEHYEVEVADDSAMLCLTLPCQLLRERVSGIDDTCGKSSFADPTLARTLRHLVGGALDMASNLDAGRLQNLCLELIDMMISGGPADHTSRSYADLMAAQITTRLRSLIEKNVFDRSWTVDKAAAACRISVRQLQHALQRQGTNFREAILNARLDKAQRLLKLDDGVPRLIGTVAAECGFATQAHFATTYRKRYGRSPKEERSR